jgi:hypothetical protein
MGQIKPHSLCANLAPKKARASICSCMQSCFPCSQCFGENEGI